ncbi:pectinacetylesterase family protein [Pendulispora rubella]|uniref:Pectinacetylesterase family protein n=1 Tax=Pendulispora rubella TaxID=2741070 RepID=A0ABZ2L4V8_9BACT
MASHGTFPWLAAFGLALLAPSIPACSSASSGSDRVDRVDPGADAPPPSPPSGVPARTWTWVDIPGSKCGNGQPTGIGVYVEPESPELIFYMAGGGACWDGETCYGLKEATYMDSGYTKRSFESDSQALLIQTIPLGNNPLSGRSMVYVPYCTGDDHAGSNVISYDYDGVTKTAHHVGYDNVGKALDYAASTWPGMKRLILAGVSAGGFGTVFNFDRVQQRFPKVRVDGIDDSGPMIQPAPGIWETVRANWNVQLPPDCPACKEVPGYFDFLATKYSKGPNRFALISYTFDSVIAGFMNLSGAVFNALLEELGRKIASSWPAARYYYIPGTLHVGIANDTSPAFYAWVGAMLDDDPKWANFPK